MMQDPRAALKVEWASREWTGIPIVRLDRAREKPNVVTVPPIPVEQPVIHNLIKYMECRGIATRRNEHDMEEE
jgi:hypothetical protein